MALKDDLLVKFKSILDVQDNEIDDLLLEILDISESYIYDYYNVAIYERDLVERVNKIYGNSIYTKKGIVTELVDVKIDGESIDSSTLIEFEVGENNRIYLPPLFTIADNQIMRIEYKVGYNDIDLVPEGLISGLCMLGKKVYNDVMKDTDSIVSMSTGIREQIKVIDDIPPMIENLLSSFRMFRL